MTALKAVFCYWKVCAFLLTEGEKSKVRTKVAFFELRSNEIRARFKQPNKMLIS